MEQTVQLEDKEGSCEIQHDATGVKVEHKECAENGFDTRSDKVGRQLEDHQGLNDPQLGETMRNASNTQYINLNQPTDKLDLDDFQKGYKPPEQQKGNHLNQDLDDFKSESLQYYDIQQYKSPQSKRVNGQSNPRSKNIKSQISTLYQKSSPKMSSQLQAETKTSPLDDVVPNKDQGHTMKTQLVSIVGKNMVNSTKEQQKRLSGQNLDLGVVLRPSQDAQQNQISTEPDQPTTIVLPQTQTSLDDPQSKQQHLQFLFPPAADLDLLLVAQQQSPREQTIQLQQLSGNHLAQTSQVLCMPMENASKCETKESGSVCQVQQTINESILSYSNNASGNFVGPNFSNTLLDGSQITQKNEVHFNKKNNNQMKKTVDFRTKQNAEIPQSHLKVQTLQGTNTQTHQKQDNITEMAPGQISVKRQSLTFLDQIKNQHLLSKKHAQTCKNNQTGVYPLQEAQLRILAVEKNGVDKKEPYLRKKVNIHPDIIQKYQTNIAGDRTNKKQFVSSFSTKVGKTTQRDKVNSPEQESLNELIMTGQVIRRPSNSKQEEDSDANSNKNRHSSIKLQAKYSPGRDSQRNKIFENQQPISLQTSLSLPKILGKNIQMDNEYLTYKQRSLARNISPESNRPQPCRKKINLKSHISLVSKNQPKQNNFVAKLDEQNFQQKQTFGFETLFLNPRTNSRPDSLALSLQGEQIENVLATTPIKDLPLPLIAQAQTPFFEKLSKEISAKDAQEILQNNEINGIQMSGMLFDKFTDLTSKEKSPQRSSTRENGALIDSNQNLFRKFNGRNSNFDSINKSQSWKAQTLERQPDHCTDEDVLISTNEIERENQTPQGTDQKSYKIQQLQEGKQINIALKKPKHKHQKSIIAQQYLMGARKLSSEEDEKLNPVNQLPTEDSLLQLSQQPSIVLQQLSNYQNYLERIQATNQTEEQKMEEKLYKLLKNSKDTQFAEQLDAYEKVVFSKAKDGSSQIFRSQSPQSQNPKSSDKSPSPLVLLDTGLLQHLYNNLNKIPPQLRDKVLRGDFKQMSKQNDDLEVQIEGKNYLFSNKATQDTIKHMMLIRYRDKILDKTSTQKQQKHAAKYFLQILLNCKTYIPSQAEHLEIISMLQKYPKIDLEDLMSKCESIAEKFEQERQEFHQSRVPKLILGSTVVPKQKRKNLQVSCRSADLKRMKNQQQLKQKIAQKKADIANYRKTVFKPAIEKLQQETSLAKYADIYTMKAIQTQADRSQFHDSVFSKNETSRYSLFDQYVAPAIQVHHKSKVFISQMVGVDMLTGQTPRMSENKDSVPFGLQDKDQGSNPVMETLQDNKEEGLTSEALIHQAKDSQQPVDQYVEQDEYQTMTGSNKERRQHDSTDYFTKRPTHYQYLSHRMLPTEASQVTDFLLKYINIYKEKKCQEDERDLEVMKRLYPGDKQYDLVADRTDRHMKTAYSALSFYPGEYVNKLLKSKLKRIENNLPFQGIFTKQIQVNQFNQREEMREYRRQSSKIPSLNTQMLGQKDPHIDFNKDISEEPCLADQLHTRQMSDALSQEQFNKKRAYIQKQLKTVELLSQIDTGRKPKLFPLVENQKMKQEKRNIEFKKLHYKQHINEEGLSNDFQDSKSDNQLKGETYLSKTTRQLENQYQTSEDEYEPRKYTNRMSLGDLKSDQDRRHDMIERDLNKDPETVYQRNSLVLEKIILERILAQTKQERFINRNIH